jgi:integrase
MESEASPMSSLAKQPNGRWLARYRDMAGRSRSKTFVRKLDAQRFLDQVSTDIRRGDWIDPQTRQIRFDDWANQWWRTTTKLRPTTRRGYWGVLEHRVKPYFKGRRLTDINYMDVETYIADLLEEGLSPKYVRECVCVVSLVMKSAVKANLRKDNPAAAHNVPLHQTKLHEGDVLTMEQAHELIAQIKDPYKPAVWLILLAGLRPAELCGLRVCDLNPTKQMLHVCQTLLPVHSFGTQRYEMVVGPTKTAAGDRKIPLPEWLCADLAKLVAERAEKRGSPTVATEYLFQTRYGNPLNRDKFREDVIRPALVAAGLPESFRTYDLRHSHASLLIDLGANLLALAQRMGHSDPAITLRVYGHLFEGTQAELSRQLDDLRAATAPGKSNVVPFRRRAPSKKAHHNQPDSGAY